MEMNKCQALVRTVALHLCVLIFPIGASMLEASQALAGEGHETRIRSGASFASLVKKCDRQHGRGRHGHHRRGGRRDDVEFLTRRFDRTFVPDTSALVEIETYRDDSPDSEQRVAENLVLIQGYLNARVRRFNRRLKKTRITPFEWKRTVDGEEHWVFGFRLGNGPRKFSVLTHLDTVPEGGVDWSAFEPRVEVKDFGSVDGSTEQPFLVGRGSIDDKGPTIVALTVLEAAAKRFDLCGGLRDWTLELSFDTSEETSAQTPFYLADVGPPELGIVFDALWSIRAEKGIERPTFSIPVGEPVPAGLWISDFSTPTGAVNQIPSVATARIESSDETELALFGATVSSRYQDHEFDDPDYNRAPLEVETTGDAVILTTHVLGAQHGSVPEDNRADGANPAVSLANFLGDLIDEGSVVGSNGYGWMVKFMQWGWGTFVFGETHPEVLQRSDDVFQDGNGTTYALTRVLTHDDEITLSIDVRYAQGHHQTSWDNVTPGLLPGESIFPQLLARWVSDFNQENPEASLHFDSRFVVAPDIRDPQSAPFQAIKASYEQVVGVEPPLYAIGGGTDAKGFPSLVAAGSLFGADFGDPINYHGINEGVPINDMRLSAQVLYRILLNTVESNDE